MIVKINEIIQVQHGQILITLLLQHAEQRHHAITVKAQIFMTTVQFFTESTGYFMQILDSLLKHLVSSIEVLLVSYCILFYLPTQHSSLLKINL